MSKQTFKFTFIAHSKKFKVILWFLLLNPEQALSVIYYLLDLYKPVITLSSENSKEGDSAFIFCNVKGTSPLFISWFKNKQKVANQNEEILPLTNITQSDAGTYTRGVKNQLTAKLSDEVKLETNCKSSFFCFLYPSRILSLYLLFVYS